MKNITFMLPFRDNEDDTIHMFNQLYDLDWPKENLRIVAVEGDSEDDTYDMLGLWKDTLPANKVTIIKLDLHVPQYPSGVIPERFYALATTYNAGLEEALKDDWMDFVFMGPSDGFTFPKRLFKSLVPHNLPHLAPMYWINLGGRVVFYDTWGFRPKGGPNWGNVDLRPLLNKLPDHPFEMHFAGGPSLLRRDILEAGCRYTCKEVDNGLCNMIRDAGFEVRADPNTHVYHRSRDG